MTLFNRFLKDESGATAIEYALIAALIGVTLVIVLGQVGTSVGGVFTKIDTEMQEAIK